MSGMDIDAIQKQVDSDIQNLDALAALEEMRIKYLGRKGIIAQLTGSIPGLPKEERAAFGQAVNALKNKITSLIAEKEKSLSGVADKKGMALKTVDIGLPGIAQELGHLHPLTQIMDGICNIFISMGFSVMEGPEVENEYNNFTALNIPLEHPSRDAFDTFYLRSPQCPAVHSPQIKSHRPSAIGHRLLLRSHTSPVQIRAMQEHRPPLAIIVPGRVYRPDAVDASHSFMFHQIEGLLVGEDIKFSDLKGVLETFAKQVFGKDIKMRFRPHFFPFTEPSAEVDISCIICKGRGCSSCGRKGWLEILGAGMVHPNVFKRVGIDPKKYTGFAFGLGIERIAMLKYGINDIRIFFENDIRFLKQF